MKLDKKALKAKLLEQYQAHLDDALDQLDDDHRLHISEIEDMALDLLQEVGEDVTADPRRKSAENRGCLVSHLSSRNETQRW